MEIFLVVLIVALAAGWLFRRIRRSVRHPVCSGCGGCSRAGSRSAPVRPPAGRSHTRPEALEPPADGKDLPSRKEMSYNGGQ